MKFQEYIKNPSLDESNLSMKEFIDQIKKFRNVDDALEKSPEAYTEFFIKNINNKKLSSELRKNNIQESDQDYGLSPVSTTGSAPVPGKIKKIRYKGDFIILKYDSALGWIPNVSFRSITQALVYIKNVADEFKP